MSENQKKPSNEITGHTPAVSASRALLSRLIPLSGMDALNQILDHEDPGQLVQGMTRVDLFWLVKKIGEDDALPLLRLASNEQWEHFIDIAIWHRDRIDPVQAVDWMGRLFKADPDRLSAWLYEDDNPFGYYIFLKTLEVIIKTDDDQTFPDGFFTLDNEFYIHILDKEHEEVIGALLRHMAQVDFTRYQAILHGLAGVIPAEMEEEMYRLKGVRLAEVGYLPFEEAISVYSYKNADLLEADHSPYQLFLPEDDEAKALVPILPFSHTQGDNLLAVAISRITDHTLLDRLRLEFAGLCNQILSADGTPLSEIDVLLDTCRKAAGYINVGLEKVSGGDTLSAERFLKNNPLISIFQAGFGLSLDLKWEMERWLKVSWSGKHNLGPDFWGDQWGPVLEGLFQKIPLFAAGLQGGEGYRGFERFSEIEDCRGIVNHVSVLDQFMACLYADQPPDEERLRDPLITFHPLIFHFWAETKLGVEPGLRPLSIEQFRQFFAFLRHKEQGPPFQMSGHQDVFIEDLFQFAQDFPQDLNNRLRDALIILWQEFVEEYAWVTIEDLDHRFTRYFFVKPIG